MSVALYRAAQAIAVSASKIRERVCRFVFTPRSDHPYIHNPKTGLCRKCWRQEWNWWHLGGGQ
jgi:hypothetical protein